MSEAMVRKAGLDDAESVYRLLTAFAVSYRPRRDKFDQTFPELLTSAAVYLPVSVMADEIVGYALALRVPTLYANGALWELQELMVAPEYRRQGVGGRLLDSVIAHAQRDGAMEVVVPSRRAGGYYLRHGFAETATYYKFKLTAPPEEVDS